MKTIVKNLLRARLYSFETHLPKRLFIFIHLVIIGIFLFVIAYSGNAGKPVTLNAKAGFSMGDREGSRITPICARQYKNVVYLAWTTDIAHQYGYYLVERYEKGKSPRYIDIKPVKPGLENALYSSEDLGPHDGSFFYKIWFISGENSYSESEKIYPENEVNFLSAL